MPIALKCICSAKLEVDEAFAGKTIVCPDCNQPLQVPAGTDHLPAAGWAVASLTLGLVGLLTIVGSVLAIVGGVLGLRQMRQQREQVGGRNLAWAGIGVGILGLVLTGLVLGGGELPVLSPWLRQSQWVGKLDFPEHLEMPRGQDGFVITRPGRSWGVLRESPFRSSDTNRPDQVFLMVEPGLGAVIGCLREEIPGQPTQDEICNRALDLFRQLDLSSRPPQRGSLRGAEVKVYSSKQVATGAVEIIELLVDKRYRGQERTYVLRICRKPEENTFHIAVGGAPRPRFARVETPIRTALDSFRLIDGVRPRDWQLGP